ncbi:hypothetical protein [Cupriavidus basilensis]|uniref:hypothetical protein n=1 Tax=Cupriavidus basilensis TaxID=68895 RepID=UPI0023E770F3|nr:hypothetical protein [Cupriavidus basilensis]MDF3885191.1 hypothetical protein [Cupriavidus basilensis]
MQIRNLQMAGMLATLADGISLVNKMKSVSNNGTEAFRIRYDRAKSLARHLQVRARIAFSRSSFKFH